MRDERTFRPSRPTRRIGLLCALSALIAGAPMAIAQDSLDVDLISETAIGTSAGDIWVADDVAYLARVGDNGVSLIDVSDPFQPSPLAIYQTAATWGTWDVKAEGGFAYLAPQFSGVGLVILDVTNPASPQLVSEFSPPRAASVHNVWVDRSTEHAYLASNTTGDVEIVDISNPASPNLVASFSAFDGSIHDMVVQDGILYAAFLSGGLYLADVSDPANPRLLGFIDYPGAFTHNAWPSKDGRYVFTTDEVNGGHVRVFDVRNPAVIQQVGSYQAGPGDAIVHNVVTWGDYIHVAYYSEGYRIIDVSDPASPVELGFFDTFAGPSGGFDGAWGVYPFDGFAYVSDIDRGLLIFNYTGLPHQISVLPDGPLSVPRGGSLPFEAIVENNMASSPVGDYWLSVRFPNQNEIVVPPEFLDTANPLSGQVPPFDFIGLANTLQIPPTVSPGSYSLIGRIGTFPGSVLEESSLDFEVTN